MLDSDWQTGFAFVALPLLVFAAYEFVGFLRRRREKARAHRSKERQPIGTPRR